MYVSNIFLKPLLREKELTMTLVSVLQSSTLNIFSFLTDFENCWFHLNSWIIDLLTNLRCHNFCQKSHSKCIAEILALAGAIVTKGSHSIKLFIRRSWTNGSVQKPNRHALHNFLGVCHNTTAYHMARYSLHLLILMSSMLVHMSWRFHWGEWQTTHSLCFCRKSIFSITVEMK